MAFRTRSVEAVRSLVAIGAGVALLSDLVYRPEGGECELVALQWEEVWTAKVDLGLVAVPTGYYERWSGPGLGAKHLKQVVQT